MTLLSVINTTIVPTAEVVDASFPGAKCDFQSMDVFLAAEYDVNGEDAFFAEIFLYFSIFPLNII